MRTGVLKILSTGPNVRLGFEQSQIGWISKSKANESYCLYPNVKEFFMEDLSEIPREGNGKAFVYKQSHVPLSKRFFKRFGNAWKP